MSTQSTAVAKRDTGEMMENVIAKGDLTKLTAQERAEYYMRVCESIGLNPLTRPLEYITLNNKLTLYARRDAADQLRKIHGISLEIVSRTIEDGIFTVHVRAKNSDGRTDEDFGAVQFAGLKGDVAANAILKCVTKAKRRATLSICGLGFLDETEIETIPAANVNGAPPKRTQADISANKVRKTKDYEGVVSDLAQIDSLAALERYQREHLTPDFMAGLGNAQYEINELYERRKLELSEPAEEHDPETGELTRADWPSTRAEYVQFCHDRIDSCETKTELAKWWTGEAMARRRFSLNPAEVDDLKERVVKRQREIEAAPKLDKGGNELNALQAG